MVRRPKWGWSFCQQPNKLLHVASFHLGLCSSPDSARDHVSVEGLRHVRRALMGGLDCEPLVDWADLNARMAVFEVDKPGVMAELVLEEQDLQQNGVALPLPSDSANLSWMFDSKWHMYAASGSQRAHLLASLLGMLPNRRLPAARVKDGTLVFAADELVAAVSTMPGCAALTQVKKYVSTSQSAGVSSFSSTWKETLKVLAPRVGAAVALFWVKTQWPMELYSLKRGDVMWQLSELEQRGVFSTQPEQVLTCRLEGGIRYFPQLQAFMKGGGRGLWEVVLSLGKKVT